MLSSLVKFLPFCALFASLTAHSHSDRESWNVAYAQASANDDQRALSLLQDRYNSLPAGYEKLHVSNLLHRFMMLHGQPYYGNTNTINGEFADLEKIFIESRNSEEQLNFMSAKEGYLALLHHAEQSQSMDGRILFEYHLCRVLNRQALYHQADVYCSSLATHIKDIEQPILPKYQALRVIANNQEFIGNYQAALDAYQELLAVIPSYIDASGAYNDAGLLLANLGSYESAIEYINLALEMRKKLGHPLQLAQTHHSLGKVTLKQQDYTTAIRHFEQSKQISSQNNYQYGITFAELGLGEAHIGLGHFDIGTGHLMQALRSATQQNNSQIRGEIYLALAKTHMEQKKFVAALDFAEHANKLAQTINSPRLEAKSLSLLAKISELQGNYDIALNYYRQYAKSELEKRDHDNKSAFLALDNTRREYLSKIETEKLIYENQDLRANQQGLEKKGNLYIFTILLLASLLLVMAYTYKQKAVRLERDGIGNALNRTACIKKVRRQKAAANKQLKNVLIMLDLDNFKAVNDQYGHKIGDKVLKHVSQSMIDHLTKEDIVGRFGGEEWLFVLRNVDELDVSQRVRQIHNSVAETHYTTESDAKITITASCAYLATSRALNDFDELYSILDHALFRIKRGSANSIIDAYHDPIYIDPAAYGATTPSPHFEI